MGAFDVLFCAFSKKMQFMRLLLLGIRHPVFLNWLIKNQTKLSILAVLTLGNINAFQIVFSKALPWEICWAPADQTLVNKVEMLGFWSMFVEDVPQLNCKGATPKKNL